MTAIERRHAAGSARRLGELLTCARGATALSYVVVLGLVAITGSVAFAEFGDSVRSSLRAEAEANALARGADSDTATGSLAAEVASAGAEELLVQGSWALAAKAGSKGAAAARRKARGRGALAFDDARQAPRGERDRDGSTNRSGDADTDRKGDDTDRSIDTGASPGRPGNDPLASNHGVCDGQGCRSVDSKFGCFVAGTPVMTPAGPVPIERIVPGDRVLSRDEQTGVPSIQTVRRTFIRTGADLASVSVRNDDGEIFAIEETPGHLFWTSERGWVKARDLSERDLLLDASGRLVHVLDVALQDERRDVYNLEVESTHTYFAGALPVWVHNMTSSDSDPANATPVGAGPLRSGRVRQPYVPPHKQFSAKGRTVPQTEGILIAPRQFHGVVADTNLMHVENYRGAKEFAEAQGWVEQRHFPADSEIPEVSLWGPPPPARGPRDAVAAQSDKRKAKPPTVGELSVGHNITHDPATNTWQAVSTVVLTKPAVTAQTGSRDQAGVMGGESAHNHAASQEPVARDGTWEWLHGIANSLGGKNTLGNLSAGTYDANTIMIPAEKAIKDFSHLKDANGKDLVTPQRPLAVTSIVTLRTDDNGNPTWIADSVELKANFDNDPTPVVHLLPFSGNASHTMTDVEYDLDSKLYEAQRRTWIDNNRAKYNLPNDSRPPLADYMLDDAMDCG